MTSVLVIDDEVDLLLALSVLLESEGYDVIQASTGEEGLAAVEHSDPDVVILDVGLPDISGVEVLRGLRGNKTRAKIIILSAHASGHTQEVTEREGADGYVTKPFDREALLETLRRVTQSD